MIDGVLLPIREPEVWEGDRFCRDPVQPVEVVVHRRHPTLFFGVNQFLQALKEDVETFCNTIGITFDLKIEMIKENDEAIYELRDDETGHLFYFNCATGVSSWEAPEWVDEVDPASGAVYYVNSLTGETTWEVPFEFIPVVREEVYSTPQASFIKTMLSPKRSRGPRNFYSADVR